MAIGIDKNGDSDRNINYEVKKQKAIEQELDHKFVCSGIKNLIFLQLSIKYLEKLNNQQRKIK